MDLFVQIKESETIYFTWQKDQQGHTAKWLSFRDGKNFWLYMYLFDFYQIIGRASEIWDLLSF